MSAPDRRKNILLISLDDSVAFWHYRSVFGAELQTPNFDRIMAQSTTFHHAYCQAPICGPSRASFMSARTPHELQVFDNSVSVFDRISPRDMWSFQLKQDGYYCAAGGKVHHGYKPLPHHIHTTLYSNKRHGFRIDRKLPAHIPQKSFGGHGDGLATTDPKDDGYYHDAHSSKSFIDFITSYDSDQPFYREVGFYSPHTPFITPVQYKEMYDPRSFVEPDDWAKGFAETTYTGKVMRQNIDPENKQRWRNSVRNYFSALSHADHHMGKVWDALKASRFADNTIVVLVSDHGFHLGERNRFRKITLWEQVANVPMMIHDPDAPDGNVVTDPVALIDLGPTILDYVGLPPLTQTVGRSLRPMVEGARDPERAIPTFYFDNAAVRKGDYRFIRFVDGSTQLFDVVNDWWQTTDLGRDHPAYAEMEAAHAACCLEYGFDIAASRVPSIEGQTAAQ